MAKPTYTLEELSRKVDAISEFLNEKTDRNLLNLNTVGQAIIDGKVEVEALLEQNGYAKFTWKEDNKVAILIVQWGQISKSKNVTFTLPTSFSKTYQAVSACSASLANEAWELYTEKISVSQLKLASYDASAKYWIAIGT